MSILYSVLLAICLLMIFRFSLVKCHTRFWLCGFMAFLAAYIGLILLDSFEARISPTAYVMMLAITFLPGPLILGYVSQISTRVEVTLKDFSLVLLPLVLALFCGDLLGGYPIISLAPKAAYELDSYIMVFNAISVMAGLHLVIYVCRSFTVLATLRKDWAKYQSKTLPQSWYDMVKLLIVVIFANATQVLSAFSNPSGNGLSLGDIGFMFLLGYVMFIAARTTRRTAGEVQDDIVIYQEQEIFIDTCHDDANSASIEADRINQQIEKEQLFLIPDLSLAMLAERVATPPHRLTEILNNELQKNFYEYIYDLRLSYAADYLLAHPEKSVTEVFYTAGFSNKSTFYGHFKKTYGTTPSNYRKVHKQNSEQDKPFETATVLQLPKAV